MDIPIIIYYNMVYVSVCCYAPRGRCARTGCARVVSAQRGRAVERANERSRPAHGAQSAARFLHNIIYISLARVARRTSSAVREVLWSLAFRCLRVTSRPVVRCIVSIVG